MNILTTMFLAIGVDITIYLALAEQVMEENPTIEKIGIALLIAIVNAILIPLVLGFLKWLKKKVFASKKLSEKQKEKLGELLDELIDEVDGDEDKEEK